MVLTDPPFGKKSSYTAVGEDGDIERKVADLRAYCVATTSNKQLNFVPHNSALTIS